MIRITIFIAMFLSLAGCVIPLGSSTGPGDNRSPYFSNGGDHDALARSSEQLPSEPSSLGLR